MSNVKKYLLAHHIWGFTKWASISRPDPTGSDMVVLIILGTMSIGMGCEREIKKYLPNKILCLKEFPRIRIKKEYIALQGTTKDPLPQVKLGETLNLQLFGVCFWQK